jgi:SET domain-containing protein
LNSDEPFYKKHKGATVNATIKINDNLHRAFLMANTDIAKGVEIFCHYGFQYWFMQEITTIGFSEEVPGELKDFPSRLFDYPAFTAYIHEFYDGVTKIETKQYDDTTNIILHMKNKETFCFPMQDLSSQITATYE